MTLQTYEAVRTSPDELIVYAHVWYVGLSLAVLCLALAATLLVRVRSGGARSGLAPILLVAAVTLALMSLNRGQMTLNKAANTFTAERTHWYGKTDTTSSTFQDVDHAFINQANTTRQLCIALTSSDRCIAIYPLDSASGIVDTTNTINAFLKEYWGAKAHQSQGKAPDQSDPNDEPQ